MDIGMRDIYAR